MRARVSLLASLLTCGCAGETAATAEPEPPGSETGTGTGSETATGVGEAAAILAGAWASADGSTRERWITLGEVAIGVGFAGDDFFEVMLLQRIDGDVVFTAMPGGSAHVDFAVAVTGDALELRNPAHDDPTQIVYRRAGDRLTVSLDGAGGPRTFELNAIEATVAPELEDLDLGFSRDSVARGGVAWAERFAADGVSWSRGSARTEGPEAIGAGIDGMQAKGQVLSWQPRASGLAANGELGFTIGRYRIDSPRVDGGAAAQLLGSGDYVTIWRRQDEGWQILYDTGVADAVVLGE